MQAENKPFPCKKVKFADQQAADYYIEKLQKTSKRAIVPTRAYLCEKCLSWHLTSRPDTTLLTSLRREIETLKAQLEKSNKALEAKNNEIKNKTKKIEQFYLKVNELSVSNKKLATKIQQILTTN